MCCRETLHRLSRVFPAEDVKFTREIEMDEAKATGASAGPSGVSM
jgi:hypothetical protein